MKPIDYAINEIKIISNPDEHFFFGYYDLQPYDSKEEKHLAHRVKFIDRFPTKNDVCDIGYINLKSGNFVKVSETTAWNFQQGALLQWYKDDEHIAYNVRTEDGFGTEILNITTGEKRVLPLACANISKDGKYGLCVNMSRIFDFRPGYGYSDVPDPFFEENAPQDDGITLMDMETGEYKQIISYADIVKQFPQEPYSLTKVLVNHITFNPSATRFMFLLRNFPEGAITWDTQLITSDLEGNMCLLTDYIRNSHYHWKNDTQLLIMTSHKSDLQNDYQLRDDMSENYISYDMPETHDQDIHCLYSPDVRYFSGDGYPDAENYRHLYLIDTEKNKATLLARVYSYPVSDIDLRCDLHARWNPNGTKLSFDSNHPGYRCICEIDIKKIVKTV